MFLEFLKKKNIDEEIEKQKEDLQKESPVLCSLALNGKNCDSLIDSNIELGHSINNPIPVNGVLGEIKYINRLRCECGSGLMYHRLGSTKNNKIDGDIDIYETVCMDGKHWDILYFHFYHPRRSLWSPSGYTFSKFHSIFSQFPLGYGTNKYDKNFPFGLGQFILLQLGEGLGNSFVNKYEEIIKDKNKFIKPERHKQKVSNEISKDFEMVDDMVIISDQDLQNKINKAWGYKKQGKLMESLDIYNQIFDFLCKEAANYAHKPKNFKDDGSTRTILPRYFEDTKAFLKKDNLACVISNNMGTIFAELGHIKAAEDMFKQSIELTPDNLDFRDPKIGLENIKN